MSASNVVRPFFTAIGAFRTVHVSCEMNFALRVMSPLLAISLCSCAAFRGVEAIPTEPQTAQAAAAKPVEQPGRATISSPRTMQPSGVQQAAYSQPVISPPAPWNPLVADVSSGPLPAGPVLPDGNLAERYPDEYLFDGGDRATPVRYGEFRRLGLDTEDTVAEYTDDLGKRRVKPTNRVAVYAPRFAAVRTVSQPASGTSLKQVSGLLEETRVAGVRTRLGTANHKGRSVPDGVRVRTRGSGIDGERKEVTFNNLTAPASNRNVRKPMEDLALLRTGVFDRTQEAVLAMGIQAAASWTKKRFPIVVGSTRDAGEVSANAEQRVMIGRETRLKKKGDLRIVKVADKETARPGEVVTFTIRYDNIGDRKLYHIRIVDNLSPRLEYVDDSADSDRKGKLVVEDNAEGSLVLKFELSEPLKGHTGGVVKFKAKVR